VHFVELAFPEIIPAMNSGRIDAGEINVSFDPSIGKPNDPVRLLGNSYDASGRASAPRSVQHDRLGEQNPDIARRFIAVMKKMPRTGRTRINTNPPNARAAHQSNRRPTSRLRRACSTGST